MRRNIAPVAMAAAAVFVASGAPALASDSASGTKSCAPNRQVTIQTSTSVQGGLSPQNNHSYNGTPQYRYGTGSWRTWAGFLGGASWYTYTGNHFLSRTVDCTASIG